MKKVTAILIVSALFAGIARKESAASEPPSSSAAGMSVSGAPQADPTLPSVNTATPAQMLAMAEAPQPVSQNTTAPAAPGGGGRYGAAAAPGTGIAVSANPGVFQNRLQSIIARAGGGDSPEGPLLILSSEMAPQAQANLEEDMTVMAHLLQRALGEAGGDGPGRVMGVNLVFTPGTDARRDLYVQGYGAIFVVRVPYPLLGLSGGGESTAQEPAPETEWEQARRELMGQPLPPEPGGLSEPYREEKVNRLTQVLLEALKNANNIRELKPDDSVTVCAIGPAAGHAKTLPRPASVDTYYRLRLPGGGPRVDDVTVLTICLTKADIENFAKGKVDLAGLRKKARITAYGCSSGPAAGGFGGGGFGGGGMGGFGGGMGGYGTPK